MLDFGACPRCKMDISPSRKQSTPVICDQCGFVSSKNERTLTAKQENHFIKTAIAISVFAIAALVQVGTWDQYAIEIIPLKIKSLIGAAQVSDQERLAQICFDLKKFSCVEDAYAVIAKSDSTKLAQLGHFQMRMGKYNEAAQNFYTYFQAGGVELEASYDYAKTLAQLGQVDEAVKYFDQVLAAKPETLQVSVVQSYVKLLMDHQRFEQAQKLIADVRKSGENAALFMENEYQKALAHTTASRD
jgi:tetratricopeptide (TPR) repeat protein